MSSPDHKIDLNAVYAEIRELVTLDKRALIVVAFEDFSYELTGKAIRAYVKVDGRVVRASKRPHKNPVDALLELYLLCGGKLDAQG